MSRGGPSRHSTVMPRNGIHKTSDATGRGGQRTDSNTNRTERKTMDKNTRQSGATAQDGGTTK
jgi:hypothetical protein